MTSDKTRPLTLLQLREAKACADQIALFQSLFGESVAVSESACLEYADKFDWDFAARAFLTPEARAEYNRVTGPTFGRLYAGDR